MIFASVTFGIGALLGQFARNIQMANRGLAGQSIGLGVARFALVALGALVISLVSARDASAACNANGCTDTIDEFYVNTGGVYLRTGGDETQLDCTLYAGVYLVLQKTHPNFDAVYSMLLLYFNQRKTITIRIVNGSTNCAVDYVRDLVP